MKDIRKFLQLAQSFISVLLFILWIVIALVVVVKAFELFYPTASSIFTWINVSFILIYIINTIIKK